MSRLVRFAAYSFAGVLSASASAGAATFATQVVAYTPGLGASIYSNPAAALGSPSPLTGENASATPSFGVNTFNPFNPGYQSDEIVRVGEGGSLTLKLGAPVAVGAGAELGVIENVSLIDASYPSGTTDTPTGTFGEDSALVEVSADGVTFVGLTGGAATDVLFNMPATYFLNGGPFDTEAPGSPIFADFGKPFTPAGGISAFDGKTSYADLLSVFEGSGGGTWLDASGTGLSQISYVRFSVPDDGDAVTQNTLEIDSVLTNSSLVPEPASAGLIAVAGLLVRRSRR